jgi:hypothetical protein
LSRPNPAACRLWARPSISGCDWDRRFGHMRIHTALHLLSVVIPLPVTGGAVGADKGRLDFDMPDAPQDRESAGGPAERAGHARPAGVADLDQRSDELDANPGLVKTLSVQPPRGAGRVRLVQIGEAPPLALAKAFSRSGCGRIFPLFSRVMREGLSTGPCAGGPEAVSQGRYSPDLMTAQIW